MLIFRPLRASTCISTPSKSIELHKTVADTSSGCMCIYELLFFLIPISIHLLALSQMNDSIFSIQTFIIMIIVSRLMLFFFFFFFSNVCHVYDRKCLMIMCLFSFSIRSIWMDWISQGIKWRSFFFPLSNKHSVDLLDSHLYSWTWRKNPYIDQAMTTTRAITRTCSSLRQDIILTSKVL